MSTKTQLAIIGGGPGGYTAAFRAADLGLDVMLIERWPVLGGVCLNVGCIPTKTLVASARAPSSWSIRADPRSQGFGSTKKPE